MKEKQREDIQQRIQKRSESLKLKSSHAAKLIKEQKEKLGQNSEDHKLRLKSSFEQIRLNNIRQIKIENMERKHIEEKVTNRLNKFSNLRLEKLEETKTKFINRSARSEDHFKFQWKKLEEKEIEKKEYLKEKAFDKFANYVY